MMALRTTLSVAFSLTALIMVLRLRLPSVPLLNFSETSSEGSKRRRAL
jgi:hypothetical protein